MDKTALDKTGFDRTGFELSQMFTLFVLVFPATALTELLKILSKQVHLSITVNSRK